VIQFRPLQVEDTEVFSFSLSSLSSPITTRRSVIARQRPDRPHLSSTVAGAGKGNSRKHYVQCRGVECEVCQEIARLSILALATSRVHRRATLPCCMQARAAGPAPRAFNNPNSLPPLHPALLHIAESMQHSESKLS